MPTEGQFHRIASASVTVEGDGHFEGSRHMLPWELTLGGFGVAVAREEMAVSGSIVREEACGQEPSSCRAHLGYHTDAPHNDCGFGLSATHSAQPGGDKDLPSEVLDAQVPSAGVQHGELPGEEEKRRHLTSPAAHQPPTPCSHLWPCFSPLCHGRFPGDRCSSSCLLSSGHT